MSPKSLVKVLGRYAGKPLKAPEHQAVEERERCALCGVDLEATHRHIVETDKRALLCSCRACALLFTENHFREGRYHTVPTRVLTDPTLFLSEEQWSALAIPVGLAFVWKHAKLDTWIACFPSPAGATESELPAEGWTALVNRSPLIQSVEPDVEAILIRRPRGGETETFLAPIDACYALVAIVRKHWQGFSGGTEAWAQIDAFFVRLRAESRVFKRARPEPAEQNRSEVRS